MKVFLLLAFCAPITSVNALPVESRVDKPLDLSHPWRYYRQEAVYVQHLCPLGVVKTMVARARNLHMRLGNTFNEHEVELPLQIRLYASAAEYRRTFRFSRYRDGHYNPELNLVVAHCGIALPVFEEQLALAWLKNAQLRWWQRHLLAEMLPYLDGSGAARTRKKNDPKEIAPLVTVLLSDHPLGEAEKNALENLVRYLAKKNKLRDFLLGLYAYRHTDDTGIELIDELAPGFAWAILRQQENLFIESNNTLRKHKK